MVQRRHRLLLTYAAADVPQGGAAVYSSIATLSQSHGKEPAGHIYHIQALKQAGLFGEKALLNTSLQKNTWQRQLVLCRLHRPFRQGTALKRARELPLRNLFSAEPDPEDIEEDQQSESEGSSMAPSREGSTIDFSSLNQEDDKWKGKGRKRKSKKREGVDLYALLGLQQERWMASEGQIKAAYRRAALEHHPDKQRSAAGGDEAAMQAAEDRFKAIQEAYETLMEPAKRREYDSLDPFDDSLPSEGDGATASTFFARFGATFRRNSKWSVNQPVPDLGEDDTDFEHVEAFYEFWFSFKSWREFPHPDEEDVESAECREERRWIERHNAKLREKGKKEEFRRVRDFVELAHRLDPRVQRHKEAQRAERERQKAEREAERQRRAEEAQRKIEEEARRKAEEEEAAAAARKQRQVEKKALQKSRARLRKLCGVAAGDDAPVLTTVDEDDVELLCARLDLSSIHGLCEQLAATHLGEAEKLAAVEASLASVRTETEIEQKKKEAAAAAATAAAKLAAQQEAAERASRLKEWDDEEVRLLRKALDKFPPGTSKRWDAVQAYVRTRTVEEVLDMVKHGLKTGKYAAPSDAGLQIAKKRQGNTVINSEATRRVESFSDVDVNLRGQAVAVLGVEGAAVEGTSNGGGSTAATAPAAAKAAEEWSAEEEVKLVKALKEVPKDAADRWDQVAAAVGTKSKTECARKFKQMKDSYKAKKSGGT